MRAILTAVGLLVAAGQACGQWRDDFNRSDGPLGPSWVGYAGPLAGYTVSSWRGRHTGFVSSIVAHASAAGSYRSFSQTIDVFKGSDGLEYVALASGLGGAEGLFIKVQSQDSPAAFNWLGFYRGLNAAGWPGAAPDFVTATAPFASARMQVYFTDDGDTLHLALDTNFDGIPEQSYTRGGVKALSAGFGTGFGIGAYGTTVYDNWRIMPAVVPVRAHASTNVVPFGPSTTDTMHQVFRSLQWDTPVRITGVRFAPMTMGTMSSSVSIALGYTGRTPGVASPAGLSVPSGLAGAPNAVGPMSGFYSNSAFTKTVSAPGTEDFSLAFESVPGFVYFPGVGNLLMQVHAITGASQGMAISRADGGPDSSRSFVSVAFGSQEDPTRAARVQLVAMPYTPDVLPTWPHVAGNFLPFGGTTATVHQVHHAGTLAPLAGGSSGKVAIQGIRFAPTQDGLHHGSVNVLMGYTARVPGVSEPSGLSVPAAGGGGAPNALGAMRSFYDGTVNETFTGTGPENFQMNLHQRPFVFDPAQGNLLIELRTAWTSYRPVSRSEGSPEASRAFVSSEYGSSSAPTTASRIRFVTTPVTEAVMPNQAQNNGLRAPFGIGKHVVHQVLASSQFGGDPVRIDSIAFSPFYAGTYQATDVTVRLGYTSREPGQSEPLGPSAPAMTGDGVPNATVSPLAVFRTGPYAQTVTVVDPADYSLVLQGDAPFLYDPARGNLLVEVSADVPATTLDQATYAYLNQTPESSLTFSSTRFGVWALPGYSNLIRFTYYKDLYPCVADINGDGTEDLSDFFAFFGCFDISAQCADVDGVPGVDLGDFFAFFAGWDVGC